MRVQSPKDFYAGVTFVALGVAFVIMSSQYNLGMMRRPGPASFPMIVAAIMAFLGLIITTRSIVFGDNSSPLEFHFRPIALTVIAIALFGSILDWFGLVAAIVVQVFAVSFAAPRPGFTSTLLLACAIAGFSVLVFVGVLGLPIRLWPSL